MSDAKSWPWDVTIDATKPALLRCMMALIETGSSLTSSYRLSKQMGRGISVFLRVHIPDGKHDEFRRTCQPYVMQVPPRINLTLERLPDDGHPGRAEHEAGARREVNQQQRPLRAGGQMQTLTVQIFEPSKPFGGICVAENAPEFFVAAIQELLALTIQRGQPSGEGATILEFVWNGEGVPGLLAGDMADDEAIFLLSDVLEETAGIWADLDAKIACYTSSGVGNNRRIKRIGDLTVRQCLHAVEIH